MHCAPWGPWDGGVSFLAIDAKHRLIASVDVPDENDWSGMVAARKDLMVALEIAESIGVGAGAGRYVDPYDDGYDDGNDCGDAWKRDTPYDPRNRR